VALWPAVYDHLSNSRRILIRSAVSLFSGCGGFDAGFTSGAFRVIEAHDIDPVAIQTYNTNHAAVGYVTDLRKSAVDIAASDVIIAGPPCQGFSTIGSLKVDDERNSLLLSACRIVIKRRPKLLVLENVMGLTTSRKDRSARFKWYLSPILCPYLRLPYKRIKEPFYASIKDVADWLDKAGISNIAKKHPATPVQRSLF
jgi:site-specific DNA-cytosine methylase